MSEQELLLHKIDVASFALDDTRLFLDTHPECEQAVCYYDKLCQMRDHALEDYACKYGQLCAYRPSENGMWGKNPLPWENGGNA